MRIRRTVAYLVGAVFAVAGSTELLLRAQPPQAVTAWASIGAADPMAARTGAAVVTLADGRTLVAGGVSLHGAAIDSVVIHDPLTNASTTAGRLMAARVNASAARLDDGRVLVTGGDIDGLASADAELFDPVTGSSSFVSLMAQPRAGHASARLDDGTVLLVGGVTTSGAVLATAERFDPSTNSISPLASMTLARAGVSATPLLDGRVLVAGGHDGVQDLASAEIYSPREDTFSAVETPMSVARAGHSAVLLPHNNSVLIAGGTSAGVAVKTADLFVPALLSDPYSWGMGSFVSTGAMVHARSQAVAGPWGDAGYAFAIGGGAGDGEVYRFATVKTDKDDYAPGELAVITGSGWEPNEDVTLVLQEDPAVHPDYELTVTADAEGDFVYDQWAPEGHDAGVRFYLMATGRRSKALTTFTDGNLVSDISFTLGGVTAVSPTAPASLAPGTTVSWSLSATCTDSGLNTCASEGYTAGGPVQDGYAVVIQRSTNFSFTQNLVTSGAIAVSGGVARGTVTIPGAGGPYYYRVRHLAQNMANLPVAGTTTNAWQAKDSFVVQVRLAAAATKLVFVNAPVSGPVNQCLGPIEVQAQDAGSAATAVASDLLVGLSVSAGLGRGALYADSTCTAPAVTSVTIPGGSHTVRAYYRATLRGSGTHSLSATAPGLFEANQSAAITSRDQAPVTIAAPASATYGQTGLGVAGGGGSGSGAFSYSHGASTACTVHPTTGALTIAMGVGTCNVTATKAGDADYDEATSAPATIQILKAPLTITANDRSKTYGAAVTFAGSAFTTSAFVGSDSVTSVTLTSAGAAAGADVGGYAIVPSAPVAAQGTALGNYTITYVNGTLTVNPAVATVTVNGYTGTYDAAPHGATGSATGVDGVDLSAGLNLGAPFTDAPGGAAHWTFDGGLNYEDQRGSVAIVINKADAIVSVTGYAGTYDAAPHGATGSATGVNGVDLSAGLNLGATFTNVPGGTADWTFAGGTNYANQSGSVAVVIGSAPMTVTAADRTKIFGDTSTFDMTTPSPDFAVSGLLGADSVTSVALSSTGAAANAVAGSYPVVPSAAVGSGLANYAVAYVNGTLTVRYAICLQYDPLKVHQAGSTVPLKITLCDTAGNNVSSPQVAVTAVTLSTLDGAVSHPASASGNANPGNVFRFDGGMYLYNLSLKTVTLSGTWTLSFTVNGVADPAYAVTVIVK